MPRLDDMSLILTKAYKAGFLQDVYPNEEAWLRREAANLFSDDISYEKRKTVAAATNVWAPNGNGSGVLQTVGGTFRSIHKVPYIVTDLQLVYGNFAISNTGDAPNAAAMTIRAGIKINGTIYRVYFGEGTDKVLQPGGITVSNPLSIPIAAGTVIEVLTYTDGTSWYPVTVSGYTSQTGGYSASDLTAPGSAAVPDAVKYMFSPTAILGTPLDRNHKSVSIEGDSISVGTGSTNAKNWSYSDVPGVPLGGSFIQRALGGDIPYIHVGRGGETASGNASGSRAMRMSQQKHCSSAIIEYGINDIVGGRSFASLQTDLLNMWKTAAGRGQAVFQTTITPKTNSSDSWATTANQTIPNVNQELVRTSINDWIRTIPAPLTGYFEVADVAETSRNSGIWKAGGTTDGTHPSESMHETLKAAIDVNQLI